MAESLSCFPERKILNSSFLILFSSSSHFFSISSASLWSLSARGNKSFKSFISLLNPSKRSISSLRLSMFWATSAALSLSFQKSDLFASFSNLLSSFFFFSMSKTVHQVMEFFFYIFYFFF